MSRRAITWTVAASLLLVAAMAYGSTRQRVDAPDETTVLADSMLIAFNTDNYKKFSSEFTTAYRTEMDQAAFDEWRAPLFETLGRYLTITDTKVKNTGGGDSVKYVFTVSFEKDPHVQFSITLKSGSTRITQVDMKPNK